MPVNVEKLFKLYEQHANAGTGHAGYRAQLREMMGVDEDDNGLPRLNRDRPLDPTNVSLSDVARVFLGRSVGKLNKREMRESLDKLLA